MRIRIYHVAAIIIGVCVIVCGVIYAGKNSADKTDAMEYSTETSCDIVKESDENESVARYCVYVCGEVITPGLYYLDADSRVGDAIELAGGMSENANEAGINLADHIEDGAKIYIPSLEDDTASSVTSQDSGGTDDNGLVNINTASKEELTTLPGIGEARAESIIAYREESGPFSSIEDIMSVSGIKDAAFDKIKDLICV